MFIAIPGVRSPRGNHGSPKSIMKTGLGNGRLASAIAAMLLLAVPLVIGTKSFTAPNNDPGRGGISTPTVTSAQIFGNGSPSAPSTSNFRAAETASSPSEIMDSYDSVPSLAALSKQGNTGTRTAPEAAEPNAVVASGIRL